MNLKSEKSSIKKFNVIKIKNFQLKYQVKRIKDFINNLNVRFIIDPLISFEDFTIKFEAKWGRSS